jgi:DNA processing protein
MVAANQNHAYLFLSLLQARVGSSLMRRIPGGETGSLLQRSAPELAREMKLGEKATRALADLAEGFDAAAVLDRLRRKGFRAVTYADEAYPARLRVVPDPPPALFVGGELGEGLSVAIVGSRRASRSGLETAEVLGRALAARGACVVSGLAAGVDAAAHEGALAGGGSTVGVLGCGIDVVYPRENRELFGRVREGGALVSEYVLGEAPLAWRFPARNRIIAGLSDAVVVVEAPEKSGALITARHAVDAGRDVWAVPGPRGAPECRGSNRLLADGAGVLWDVDEFLDAVCGPAKAPGPTRDKEVVPVLPDLPDGLPEREAEVLRGLLGAVETYDPSRPTKFETYAISKIRWSILDELRKADPLPRSARLRMQRMERVRSQLTQRYGRAPTESETVGVLGVSITDHWAFLDRVARSKVDSLEAGCEALEGGLHDLVAARLAADPGMAVERAEVRAILVRAIGDLGEQERVVTTFYYYEGLTLREIGGILGLTEGRISQILRAAMIRLRGSLSDAVYLLEGTPGDP